MKFIVLVFSFLLGQQAFTANSDRVLVIEKRIALCHQVLEFIKNADSSGVLTVRIDPAIVPSSKLDQEVDAFKVKSFVNTALVFANSVFHVTDAAFTTDKEKEKTQLVVNFNNSQQN